MRPRTSHDTRIHDKRRKGSGKQFKPYRLPADRPKGDRVFANCITRIFFAPGIIGQNGADSEVHEY